MGKSWLEGIPVYLGVYAPDGSFLQGSFLPICCVNCKKLIKVEDACKKLGYWRHKRCWKAIMSRPLDPEVVKVFKEVMKEEITA